MLALLGVVNGDALVPVLLLTPAVIIGVGVHQERSGLLALLDERLFRIVVGLLISAGGIASAIHGYQVSGI